MTQHTTPHNQFFKVKKINNTSSGCEFDYEIVLNNGQSKQIQKVNNGETINFKRTDQNGDDGFTLTFPDASTLNHTEYDAEWGMTVSSANEGAWYYSISVPDLTIGSTTYQVKPLDPIIIINPDQNFKFNFSSDYLSGLIIFALGFLAAWAISYIRRRAMGK